MPKAARLRGMVLLVRTAWRADPLRAIGVLSVTIVESAVRATGPLALKIFTDGIVQHARTAVLVGSVFFGGRFVLLGLTNLARIDWQQVLTEKTSFEIDARLIELSAGIPTLEHHERPDLQDEMRLLMQSRSAMGNTLVALVQNLLTYSMLAWSVVLLATVHPLLALLPLFALPSAFGGSKAVILRQKALEDSAEDLRLDAHLLALATTAEPAKEVRIFGLEDELRRRHDELWDRFDQTMRGAELRGALLSSGTWAIFAAGFAGALAFVALRAIAHPSATSLGQLVMTIAITTSLNGQLSGAVSSVRWLRGTLKAVGRMLWLIDYSEAARRTHEAHAEPPGAISGALRFEDVSFTYPGTEREVLTGVTLEIPAGATVAIVGENGAGKTTLAKLLLRFYIPTKGRVHIDGADIAEMDVDAWRARASAAFQDFAKLELLARETVGVGKVSAITDEGAVHAALERARAADVMEALPRGLETQLGRAFTDGVELSVGQWQKLALGRGMMRETPLLLVLDEPTASLDAETEHALFERYASAARRAATKNGAITVLVSHRFSTVRMADLIIVLNGGRVVEQGAHEELIARGGLYAELYELQARSYK